MSKGHVIETDKEKGWGHRVEKYTTQQYHLAVAFTASFPDTINMHTLRVQTIQWWTHTPLHRVGMLNQQWHVTFCVCYPWTAMVRSRQTERRWCYWKHLFYPCCPFALVYFCSFSACVSPPIFRAGSGDGFTAQLQWSGLGSCSRCTSMNKNHNICSCLDVSDMVWLKKLRQSDLNR